MMDKISLHKVKAKQEPAPTLVYSEASTSTINPHKSITLHDVVTLSVDKYIPKLYTALREVA